MLRQPVVILLVWIVISEVSVAQAPHVPTADERTSIEKLHEQDITATIAHDPKLLCALWSDDAVRFEPGSEPDIGKEAICAKDAKEIASHPNAKITYYPRIRDVQVIGNTAYEWDTFDASSQGPNDAKPRVIRGKALRVLRRQPDGSWLFSRVMWNVSE